MSIEIYSFSGTGNSLQVAKEIGSKFNDSKVISINSRLMSGSIKAQSKTVGIVFPVYFAGVPVMVADFINKIDLSEVDYIFSVTTCGEPFSSRASTDCRNLFKKRGEKLDASFNIKMPGNYIIMYESKNDKFKKGCFDSLGEKVDTIFDIVKSSKKHHDGDNIVVKTLGPLLYKYFTKTLKNKDKKFTVEDSCTGCGICEKVCPANNIKVDGNPSWHGNCEQCLACIQYCPKESIQFGKGTKKRKRYVNPFVNIKEMMGDK